MGMTNSAWDKASLRGMNSAYDAACTNTEKKQQAYKAAQDKVNEKKEALDNAQYNVDTAQQKVDEVKDRQAQHEKDLDQAESEIETHEDNIEEINDRIEEKQDKIKELREENTPESIAEANAIEASLEDDKAALIAENNALNKAKEDKKKAEEALEQDEKDLDEAEKDLDFAEEQRDKAEDEYEDAKDDADDAYDDLQDAKEEEEEVKEEQSEKYPDTFGKTAEQMETDQKAEEEAEKKKEEEEAAKAEQQAFEEQKKEEIESCSDCTQETIQQMEAAGTPGALELAEQHKEMRIKTETIIAERNKLKEMQDKLNAGGLTAEEYKQLTEDIKEEQAKLNELTGPPTTNDHGEVIDTTPPPPSGYLLHFDAPPGGMEATSFGADIVVNELYPKFKHGFKGTFPEEFGNLGWTIKTMDKPKMDIESVEQIRNNVVRHYPVKYSLGDVSVTFWDDSKNRTVKTLYEYAYGRTLLHDSKETSLVFLMRDSMVIPSFSVEEYNVESEQNQIYTFENAIVSSIEMDSFEDEADDGLCTLTVVFKFERFTIEDKNPPQENVIFNTALAVTTEAMNNNQTDATQTPTE